MTTNTELAVRPVELTSLEVEIYKPLRTAALKDTAGAVHAQVDYDPEESIEYLQYRLLTAALETRHHTSCGEHALGLIHGTTLTVHTGETTSDYQITPDTDLSNLQISGTQVLHGKYPLPRIEVSREDLLAGVAA